MKKLLFFLALTVSAQQTGYKWNPFTNNFDLAGNGYTAPSGWSNTVTAQTTLTVTAATHGQGTAPTAWCFDNASPALAVSCSYTVSSIGDVVFSWSPAFSGTVIIRGPGANAGSAGDVVGPSSSTSGALTCFSGTSGKIIAGCSALTTVGAIPYVTSAGVLGQDAGALFWDSANDRLGVGTASPVLTQDVIAGASTIFVGNGYRVARFISTAGVNADLPGVVLGYDSTGGGIIAANTQTLGQPLQFWTYSGSAWGERGRFSKSGNLLIGGGTTDGNYRLDVNTSGSTGTLRVYDQGGAGSTLAVIQAGAAQSGNLLSVRNNAGTGIMSVDATGNISTQSVTLSLASGLFFTGRGSIYPPADGVVTLADAASTSFNRLQFGGTTSSFPALKRNGATLQVRLADDSGYAQFLAGDITAVAGSRFLSTGTAYLDTTGTGGINIRVNATQATGIQLQATTGNLTIGAGTDAGYAGDISRSGSTGTLRVFDQGGAGSTLAVIQAGAAQSGNLLSVRNNAGTEKIGVDLSGNLTAAGQLSGNAVVSSYFIGSSDRIGIETVTTTPFLAFRDTGILQWSSTSAYTGSKDSGLKRAAAGYVAVTDGSSGLGKIVVSQSTPSASTDAGTAGAIWADATYLYVQTGASTVKRIALTTF